MLKIKVNRKSFKASVTNNPANWEYYWTIGINENGMILSDSKSIPCRNDGQYFFPIPAWNPEGSGREIEEFDDFTELSDSPKYTEWQNQNDGDIADYLSEFPRLKKGWEEWIDSQIESMIDNYPSGDEIGDDMDLPEFEIIWI